MKLVKLEFFIYISMFYLKKIGGETFSPFFVKTTDRQMRFSKKKKGKDVVV